MIHLAAVLILSWIALSCVVATLLALVLAGGRARERHLPRTRAAMRSWIRGEATQQHASPDSRQGPACVEDDDDLPSVA